MDALLEAQRAQRNRGVTTGREIVERLLRDADDVLLDERRAFARAIFRMLERAFPLQHPEDGAREGAPFIKKHIIRVTEKAFDDFAAGGDNSVALKTLGLR